MDRRFARYDREEREEKRIQRVLRRYGYPTKFAGRLAQAGMDAAEVDRRLRTYPPSSVYSLELTHGLRKTRRRL